MHAAGEEIASAREDLQFAYLAAWNTHDAEAIASFFSAGATYDDRGAGEVAHGPAGIRAHATRVLTAFPDLRFEIVRSAHGLDFSCGEWRATMTHAGRLDGLAPTGRVAESAGVDVATFDEDGLIRHLVSYYDGAEIMRALGLLPARHSRAERLLTRAASLRPRRS